MLDKERIILLAEEKVYNLLDKDYSDWTDSDRETALEEWKKLSEYRDTHQ